MVSRDLKLPQHDSYEKLRGHHAKPPRFNAGAADALNTCSRIVLPVSSV